MKHFALLFSVLSLACAVEDEKTLMALFGNTPDGLPPLHMQYYEEDEFKKFKESTPCSEPEFFRFRTGLKRTFYAVPKSLKINHLLISRNKDLPEDQIYKLIDSLCFVENGSILKIKHRPENNKFTFIPKFPSTPKSYKYGSCAEGTHPNLYFTNLGKMTLQQARLDPKNIKQCEENLEQNPNLNHSYIIDASSNNVKVSNKACHYRIVSRSSEVHEPHEEYLKQNKYLLDNNLVNLIYDKNKDTLTVRKEFPVLKSLYDVKTDPRYALATHRVHPDIIGLFDTSQVFTAGAIKYLNHIEIMRYSAMGYLTNYTLTGGVHKDPNAFDVIYIEATTLRSVLLPSVELIDKAADLLYPISSYAYIKSDPSGYIVRKAIIPKPGTFCYTYKPFLLSTVEERTQAFTKLLARASIKGFAFKKDIKDEHFYTCKNPNIKFDKIFINSVDTLDAVYVPTPNVDAGQIKFETIEKYQFDDLINAPNKTSFFACVYKAFIDDLQFPFPQDHACAKIPINDFLVTYFSKYNLHILADMKYNAIVNIRKRLVLGVQYLRSFINLFSLCKDSESKELHQYMLKFMRYQMDTLGIKSKDKALMLYSIYATVNGESLLQNLEKYIKSIGGNVEILKNQKCVTPAFLKSAYTHPIELHNFMYNVKERLNVSNIVPIVQLQDEKNYKNNMKVSVFGSASIMYLKSTENDPNYRVVFKNTISENCSLTIKDLYTTAQNAIASNSVSMFNNIKPILSYVPPREILPIEGMNLNNVDLDYITLLSDY